MKVNLVQGLEVSDDQRDKLADLLDSQATRRLASRDEIKAYVWEKGSEWENHLEHEWLEEWGPDEEPASHLSVVPDETVIDDMDLI